MGGILPAMPESATLSPVLRQNLSSFEQSVLTLAARGGADLVFAELNWRASGGVSSVAAAEQVIAQTREKAARVIEGARRPTPRAGRERRMATCSKHGEYTDRGRGCPVCTTAPEGGGARPRPAGDPSTNGREVPTPAYAPPTKRTRRKPAGEPPKRRPRDTTPRATVAELREHEAAGREGWPHTNGVVRKQVVTDDEEPGKAKRARAGMPANGSILPPEPGEGEGEGRVPSEQDRTMVEGDAGAPPMTRPASPESSSTEAEARPAGTDAASDSDAPSVRHQTARSSPSPRGHRGPRGRSRDDLIELLRRLMLHLGREPSWGDFRKPARPEWCPSSESFRKGLDGGLPEWIAAARDGWSESERVPAGRRDDAGRPLRTKVCEVCEEEFETSIDHAKVCGKAECAKELGRRRSQASRDTRGAQDAGEEQRAGSVDAVGGAAAGDDAGASSGAPAGEARSAEELTTQEEPAPQAGGVLPAPPAEPPPAVSAPRAPTPAEERLLADVRRRMRESQRETARIGREMAQLAVEMADELPDELLRARYLAVLLKRIEAGDTSSDLLDRFERLAGFAE